MATLERLSFSHIHAFPYSQRKGTPAADMKDQVETAEKKRRVELVNELSARQKAALLTALVGKKASVLIEKQDGTTGEGLRRTTNGPSSKIFRLMPKAPSSKVTLIGTDGQKLEARC